MDLGYIATNAIVLACIYGTLAIGISITWSSLGLINLAYGFIFTFAGYGAWLTSQYVADWPVVVVAGGILSGALGGMLVCALAFIPMHDKPNFTVRGMIAKMAHLVEIVKGSPVSEHTQMVGQYVGLMLIVMLMGIAIFNDILRLIA